MTRIVARKQARRFYGTMGAAMRSTSRWLDRTDRADTTIRHGYGYPDDRCAGLMHELLAR